MHHVRDVMQHYIFLWELIFCLIYSVQMPENTHITTTALQMCYNFPGVLQLPNGM